MKKKPKDTVRAAVRRQEREKERGREGENKSHFGKLPLCVFGFRDLAALGVLKFCCCFVNSPVLSPSAARKGIGELGSGELATLGVLKFCCCFVNSPVLSPNAARKGIGNWVQGFGHARGVEVLLLCELSCPLPERGKEGNWGIGFRDLSSQR
jgi:hypothetical protein